MDSRRPCSLDEALEGLLHREVLRPSPGGLHRRITARVRYVALQNEECRRFRRACLSLAGVGAAVVGALGMAAWWLDLPARVATQTPGVRGHLDRLAATAWHSGYPVLALGGLTLALAAGAAFAMRRRMR